MSQLIHINIAENTEIIYMLIISTKYISIFFCKVINKVAISI